MDNSINIQENTHNFWKYSTFTSVALCIVLFILFWNLNMAFWSSIFRFASFVCFALSVLGILKLMDGPLSVNLHHKEKYLVITYTKEDRIIHEEQIDYSTIKELILTKDRQDFISSYLHPSSATVRVTFTDTDSNICLFQFGGRPLFFDQSELRKIHAFFDDKEIKMKA